MGVFANESEPMSAGSLVPLSRDRVKHALERAGWPYTVDADGDIGGGWEYGSFYFFVNGEHEELLCVRGFWRGRLGGSRRTEALELCNRWNSEKLWPKTYVGRDDEGYVRLNVEHNVDYEHGLTDGQLDQHLHCAVDAGMAFFGEANEAFPEVWEQFKPEG